MLSNRMHWLFRFTFNWMQLESQKKGAEGRTERKLVQLESMERESHCQRVLKGAGKPYFWSRFIQPALLLWKIKSKNVYTENHCSFCIKDVMRFSFCYFLNWHPPQHTASSNCVEMGIDAVMETIKWSSSRCSRFQRHSFSRPSASAAAWEVFPDFTTTEQQPDGVYALQDPTGEETCCPSTPEAPWGGIGTIDNGTVHGTGAASPPSILSIMFIARYTVLKRPFFILENLTEILAFLIFFLFSKK